MPTTVNPVAPTSGGGGVAPKPPAAAGPTTLPNAPSTVAPPRTIATPTPANQQGAQGMAPRTLADALPFNANPISNPTHPAHQVANAHLGQALGHMLTGNHEAAAESLHTAIEHLMAPHREEAAARQGAQGQPSDVDVKGFLREHVGNLRAMRQGLRQSMRGSATKPKKRSK